LPSTIVSTLAGVVVPNNPMASTEPVTPLKGEAVEEAP
jgi:hypothetical protein